MSILEGEHLSRCSLFVFLRMLSEDREMERKIKREIPIMIMIKVRGTQWKQEVQQQELSQAVLLGHT